MITPKHVFNSKIPKLIKMEAITLYPFILYRAKQWETSPKTVCHELIHCAQINQLGVLRFYISYGLEYLKGRLKGMSHYDAYMNISFEKEAYSMQYSYNKSPSTMAIVARALDLGQK